MEDELQELPCKQAETPSPSQGSYIAGNSLAITEISPAKETPTTPPSKSYIDKLMDECIGYIDNEVEMKLDPSKSIEDFLLELL
ncbi:hypothetical protein AAFF_G00030930 [Aldrovandia affinis]|uniref:Uncharacterized protein n=1 Tax=Aldrovandia affinis TaxID=143900 RepID=A0AAD7S458_9TELE|nr:hypothetical protein AAFF_G00030930 [Aldrovandia affinis]